MALRLKPIFEEKAKENLKISGENTKPLQKSANPIIEKPIDTRKEIAKVANVSHDTIAKVQKIEQKAPEKKRPSIFMNDPIAYPISFPLV